MRISLTWCLVVNGDSFFCNCPFRDPRTPFSSVMLTRCLPARFNSVYIYTCTCSVSPPCFILPSGFYRAYLWNFKSSREPPVPLHTKPPTCSWNNSACTPLSYRAYSIRPRLRTSATLLDSVLTCSEITVTLKASWTLLMIRRARCIVVEISLPEIMNEHSL